MPELSIIVPCHNQRKTIELLLKSLECQSAPLTSFEVVIADDGSTDGSVYWLDNYQGPLSVQLIKSPIPIGRAAIRNLALTKAAGQRVLFLDGDMTVNPDIIDLHMKALSEQSDTVWIGQVLPALSSRQDPLAWYRASRGARKKQHRASVPARHFATNNASVSMDLLKKAGPFNEQYRTWGGEDLEMGYRLETVGAAFAFLPQAISLHDHPESLDVYLTKISIYAKSGLPLLIKNYPAHGQSTYLKYFLSDNPLVRILFSLLFNPALNAFVMVLATRTHFRYPAFLFYNYLTYRLIYRGLRETHHD